MFDKRVFILSFCVTAKFSETRNNLLKYSNVHVGRTYSREIFNINRACQLTTRTTVSGT